MLAARHSTERERSHVAVLSLAIHGRSTEALDRALTHAETCPRDALIVGLPLAAFGLLALSGMANHDQARVDLCDRHARHFAEDDWWFLTYRGWSHAEYGAVAHGRALADRGFALRRENANGAHAVSHALYEAGAGEEAERLIADWLPGYGRSGPLHGHIAWHAALGAPERSDTARALAIYGAHVQPSVLAGMPINKVTDSASFLWRLQAHGHAAPDGLWQAAAFYAAAAFPKAGSAFVDPRMAILEAASADHDGVERRAAALEALVEAGTMAAGPVVPAADDRRGGAHPLPQHGPRVSGGWQARLSLAGSETSASDPGYLAGDLDAGARAAAETLHRLGVHGPGHTAAG